MQTRDFNAHLRELIDTAAARRTAVMCAEAVPWRCHRSLIADALTSRGIEVVHIIDASQTQTHRPTSFAVIEGERVTYPGQRPLVE
jgi:uncharacterized protein (DUF488 family)